MNTLASQMGDRSAVSVADLPRAKGRRRALLGQRRWQILLGLAAAVVLPALIGWPDEALKFRTASLNNAMLGTAMALLCGYYLTPVRPGRPPSPIITANLLNC